MQSEDEAAAAALAAEYMAEEQEDYPTYPPAGYEEDSGEEVVEDFEDKMSAAEMRLAKANAYREILQSPLFSSTDAVSQEVEAEFRDFALFKLETLLGGGENTVNPYTQFTELQIQALKAIADGALDRAKGRSMSKAVPTRPTLRTRDLAPARPPIRPLAPPIRPQARAVQKAPAPATAPPPRPSHRPKSAASSMKPPVQSSPSQSPPKPQSSFPRDPNVFPEDNTVLEMKGRKYMVSWQPLDIELFGPKDQRMLRDISIGEGSFLGDRHVRRVDFDEFQHLQKKDVTPLPSDPNRLKFPGKSEMGAILQQASLAQASRMVSAAGGSSAEGVGLGEEDNGASVSPQQAIPPDFILSQVLGR